MALITNRLSKKLIDASEQQIYRCFQSNHNEFMYTNIVIHNKFYLLLNIFDQLYYLGSFISKHAGTETYVLRRIIGQIPIRNSGI